MPITPGGKETLLVVEDEEALRGMFVRELGERGYRTFEAANGREAMETLDRMGAEVDLIVSDVAMPEMNGLDLARLASAGYPRIRFVFVSGQSRESLAGIGQLTQKAPCSKNRLPPNALPPRSVKRSTGPRPGEERPEPQSIGSSAATIAARRGSRKGGSATWSPSVAGSSSTAKPGPSVAISNSTPFGSRK